MAGSIDGIFSGMNTTSIIDSLIKIEHQQVDIYTARQAEYTQKLTGWQTINSYLLAFKAQADVLSKPAVWNTQAVTSSDDTAIAVTSSGGSATGSYFVTVDRLAQSQQLASQGFSESTAIVGSGTVEIKVGSNEAKTITLDSGNNSLESLKNAINDADAGVTAAIINDGSSTNPYRLILSANETGTANQISFTTSLSGGTAPDFQTKYFDSPEKLNWDTNATATLAIGTGATYTGSVNKTYTFTVGGSGNQTVGSGPITLDWSDGTNSGTVTVNSVGEQVALTGTGADGLILSIGDGVLVAGNTFQIQAQSPIIQAGQDAIMRFGASGNGGSPITVTSSTNKVTSLIAGVTLDLKSVTDSAIEIRSESDTSKITSTINEFIKKYNDFADFIDQQSSYTPETGKAGILLGETSVINVLSDIRTSITQKVTGLSGTLTKLTDVGIKFNTSGHLELDSTMFSDKLSSSPEEVRRMFLAAGSSSNTAITFLSSGSKTIPSVSGYDVNITTAPLQGMFTTASIPNPSVSNLVINETNNNIKLKINGTSSSTIALDSGTYTSGDDLAEEIEEKLNADQSLGSNDVDVKWVGDGNNGHLEIRSTLWGANSKVELDTEPSASAHTILGLSSGTGRDGVDVAGTINGEPAQGVGQILTGNDENEKTAGLKLKITLTPEQLADGSEGNIVITRGYASIISGKLEKYTDPSTGILSSRAKSIQKQIDNIADQITRMEALLEKKRASLYTQFTAMEEAIGKLQSQGAALTAMFGSTSSSSSSTSGSSSSS
jgi:flagellar hook-associated protein 2